MKRALVVLALGVPTSLAAQSTPTTVSTYLAADAGISGAPFLVGATLTRESGWMAMRVGAAVDAGSTLLASPDPGSGRTGVLAADLDAMLYFGSPAAPPSSVLPYAFVGAGGRLLSGASTASGLNYGYGIGGRTALGSRLSAEGEIRYRDPVGAGDADAGQSAGLEFRVGMTMRVGNLTSRPRVPAPAPVSRPTAATAPVSAPVAAGMSAARLRLATRTLDTADDFLGVPYTWGGNTPDEGFDCSGFVKFVFARQGITLPRVSRDQARAGTPLPLDIAAFEPGDLIAFAPEPGATIDHIAIYAGNGRIIHSSSSGRGVRFDDLYSERGRWYRTHMVAATRVIDGAALLLAGME